MSKGRRKRARRPGGHPAKAAARRDRDEARRADKPMSLTAVAREIAREAAELASAFEAELWASNLLGSFYEERSRLPIDEGFDDDYALMFGEPLIQELAAMSDSGASVAIAAIAELDDGELGLRADKLIDGAKADGLPAWASDLGQYEITGAAETRDEVFDDARTVLIEARDATNEPMTIGVLIDHNSGGMARDILVADSLEGVMETAASVPDPDGPLAFHRIAPGVAAGSIREAIELTDRTWEPVVGDDFASLRALALARADAAPNYVVPPPREVMEHSERDALLADFLASPEASGWELDGQEAHIASLGVDFCADYGDGNPLRWSPAVVEIFMTDWIPRKVMTDDEMLDLVPDVLKGWVRYAGRRRGIPQSAIDQTCDAVDEWEPVMREEAADPAAGGPGKQFLEAAQAAGIDLDDESALGAFIAGWNARSMIVD